MARHRQETDADPDRQWSDVAVTWSPMLLGVLIMLGYVIYALALQTQDRPLANGPSLVVVSPPAVATTGVPQSTDGDVSVSAVNQALGRAPELSPSPQAPAPPPPAGPAPAPPAPPAPPAAPPAPPPAPAPPAAGVSGSYGIDATYDDVFIGKVTITNTAGRSQDWTVELAFPSNVGRLNTFWVDGTPQPTLHRTGDRYVFTSTVPVPAGSSVVLKFHFDRSGQDVDPTVCMVNGGSCTTR